MRPHEHHLWPKYMDNPHGNSYEENVSRIMLETEKHKELHYKIIIPILKKYSVKPNYNSEIKLWQFIPLKLRSEVIRQVVSQTKEWVKNGDSKATSV